MAAVFHWRLRKLSGWQRDTWRFLYKNRLEQRHWNVLEQDRVAVENMEPDANQREHLYEHDVGVSRLRRHKQSLAQKQITAARQAAESKAAAAIPAAADAATAKA